MFPQLLSSTAQTRHDCPNGNPKDVGNLFVGELFHIDEQHHRLEVRRNLIQRFQDLLVREVLGYGRRVDEVGLDELLRLLEEREAEPFPPVVVDAMKQDSKEPCPAWR
jgi:hypothetical protein